MGTRETAQPEVASESWWGVIQGARGAGDWLLVQVIRDSLHLKLCETKRRTPQRLSQLQCTVNLCRGINSERRLSVQSASPLAAPSHTYHHCSFNLAPQDVVTSPTQHTLSRARQPSFQMPPLSAPASPVACSSDQRPASMGCNRVVRGRHREKERGSAREGSTRCAARKPRASSPVLGAALCVRSRAAQALTRRPRLTHRPVCRGVWRGSRLPSARRRAAAADP